MDGTGWDTYFQAARRQDWETAQSALQDIARSDGSSPKILLQLGDIYRKTGDTINAVGTYHQAASLMHTQGLLRKALTVYKLILQLDPDNIEAVSRSTALMMELESAVSPLSSAPVKKISHADTFEEFAAYVAGKPSDSIAPELFSGMPGEKIQRILRDLPLTSFPDSTAVIEEGDSGDSMFLIKSGKARVVAHILGKEICLATLEAGDLFGEAAFLTGRPRTASVISEGPLAVYEISRAELETIIEKNPSLLQKIEDCYEYRIQDTINKSEP